VPRTGHIIGYEGALQSLTHIGPLARRVEDLQLILGVIAGPDGVDSHVVPVPLGDPAAVHVARLRVAFFTDNGIAKPRPETAAVVEAAARAVGETGAAVAEARPGPIAETVELYDAIMDADGGAEVRRILARAGTVGSRLETEFSDQERALSAGEFTALIERWDGFRSRMLRFWRDYDVLMCPVNVTWAFPHGTLETREAHGGFAAYSHTLTHNLTGWPCAVVRCGTSPEGLPIGVQVVAPPWREDVALAVAGYLEGVFGGWQAVGA
jgi:amidase